MSFLSPHFSLLSPVSLIQDLQAPEALTEPPFSCLGSPYSYRSLLWMLLGCVLTSWLHLSTPLFIYRVFSIPIFSMLLTTASNLIP